MPPDAAHAAQPIDSLIEQHDLALTSVGRCTGKGGDLFPRFARWLRCGRLWLRGGFFLDALQFAFDLPALSLQACLGRGQRAKLLVAIPGRECDLLADHFQFLRDLGLFGLAYRDPQCDDLDLDLAQLDLPPAAGPPGLHGT